MSNKKNETVTENSLAPIPEKSRIMGWGSNTMLWLGGCISIGTMAMGSAQTEAGLNLIQLLLAVAIGSLILVIGISMNDQFSYKSQKSNHNRPQRLNPKCDQDWGTDCDWHTKSGDSLQKA